MHLGNLAGSSSVYNSRQWQGQVTVTVHDADHNPVASATVRGRWDGAPRDVSCNTNASGQCTFTKNFANRKASSGFTVNNISASKGTWKYYTIEVPAGMALLDINISGGTALMATATAPRKMVPQATGGIARVPVSGADTLLDAAKLVQSLLELLELLLRDSRGDRSRLPARNLARLRRWMRKMTVEWTASTSYFRGSAWAAN